MGSKQSVLSVDILGKGDVRMYNGRSHFDMCQIVMAR